MLLFIKIRLECESWTRDTANVMKHGKKHKKSSKSSKKSKKSDRKEKKQKLKEKLKREKVLKAAQKVVDKEEVTVKQVKQVEDEGAFCGPSIGMSVKRNELNLFSRFVL